MPRTKAPNKKKVTNKPCEYAQSLIKYVGSTAKTAVLNHDAACNEYFNKLKTQMKKSKLSIPLPLLNKTIGELKELPLNWSGNSTVHTTRTLDATKELTVKKKTHLTRSSSLVDDEGYLTAESSNGTSGGRQSRTRSKQPKTTRSSRSLSNRGKKEHTSVLGKFKTPANKIAPASFGTVTPKMKPNTPQVLLRRPKQGEVALSMQGSPLLTGNVVTDSLANVNIPLDDGRLFSIQAQRGLRVSQIPELDPDVKRQLELLRDNLNKVCAISAKR